MGRPASFYCCRSASPGLHKSPRTVYLESEYQQPPTHTHTITQARTNNQTGMHMHVSRHAPTKQADWHTDSHRTRATFTPACEPARTGPHECRARIACRSRNHTTTLRRGQEGECPDKGPGRQCCCHVADGCARYDCCARIIRGRRRRRHRCADPSVHDTKVTLMPKRVAESPWRQFAVIVHAHPTLTVDKFCQRSW